MRFLIVYAVFATVVAGLLELPVGDEHLLQTRGLKANLLRRGEKRKAIASTEGPAKKSRQKSCNSDRGSTTSKSFGAAEISSTSTSASSKPANTLSKVARPRDGSSSSAGKRQKFQDESPEPGPIQRVLKYHRGPGGQIIHNWPKNDQNLASPRYSPTPRLARSPSPARAEVGRSKETSQSSKSPSADARGFTTSESRSVWSHEPGSSMDGAAVRATAEGPAIIKSRRLIGRVKEGPGYLHLHTGKEGEAHLKGCHQAQCAVRVLNDKGSGRVQAGGRKVVVSVDARRSRQGGAISKHGEDLYHKDWEHSSDSEGLSKVPPGRKAKRIFDAADLFVGAVGKINGKGLVKMTAYDIYIAEASERGSSWTSGGSDPRPPRMPRQSDSE